MKRRKVLKISVTIITIILILVTVEFLSMSFFASDTSGEGPTRFIGGTGHYTENIIENGPYDATIVAEGTAFENPYTVTVTANSSTALYQFTSGSENSVNEVFQTDTKSFIKPEGESPIQSYTGRVIELTPARIDVLLPDQLEYEYVGTGSVNGNQVSVFETAGALQNDSTISIQNHVNRSILKYSGEDISSYSAKVFVDKYDIVRKVRVQMTLESGKTVRYTITFSRFDIEEIQPPEWVVPR